MHHIFQKLKRRKDKMLGIKLRLHKLKLPAKSEKGGKFSCGRWFMVDCRVKRLKTGHLSLLGLAWPKETVTLLLRLRYSWILVDDFHLQPK